MTILIVGGVCILAVVVLAVTWALLPHGDHHASRPVHRGPAVWAREQRARAGRAARAVRRALVAVRRLPGTGRGLPAEDRATLGWLTELHHDHPDTPGVAVPDEHTRAPAATLGDQLPNRGDAQGRDGGRAPEDSRPAPGADMTGSLSPRPTEERPGPVSAPPDPGTPEDIGPGERALARNGTHHPSPAPADARTIREDWTPPTAAEIACRSCVETDEGWTCQVDLGGQCPSDPNNYLPGQDEPAPEDLPDTVKAQLAPLAALVDQLRQADDTASFERIAAGWS